MFKLRGETFFHASLSVFLLVFLIISTSSSSTASESSDEVIKIVDVGPMTDEITGYETYNPDNTYYPGDYFYVTIKGKDDGKHGRVVASGHWEWFDTLGDADAEGYWYGIAAPGEVGGRDIETLKEGKGFNDKDKFTDFVNNFLRQRSDVPEDSIKTDTDGHDNYSYYVEWDNINYKLEELEREPRVYISSGGRTYYLEYTVNSFLLEDEWKEKKIVCQVNMEEFLEGKYQDENLFPAEHYLYFQMPVPLDGINCPYADMNLEPIMVRTPPVKIVNYKPVFRAIPYRIINWKRDETDSMMQKPNGIITRYDGDGDVEGENLILDGRRVVVSGVSANGCITKPLRANQLLYRLNDDGSPDYSSESTLSWRVRVDQRGIHIKGREVGGYYRYGSVLSPVFEVPKATSFREWYDWVVSTIEPEGTHVDIYVRAGDEILGSGPTGKWKLLKPIDSSGPSYDRLSHCEVNGEERGVSGRYLQYWIILWTNIPEDNTPVLRGVSTHLRSKGESIVSFHYSPEEPVGSASMIPPLEWNERGQYISARSNSAPYMDRRLVLYQAEDLLLNDEAYPWIGSVELSPMAKEKTLGEYSGIRLEFGELELPKDLPYPAGKIDRYVPTGDGFLFMSDVSLSGCKRRKVDNEVVFEIVSGAFRYDNSSRYKKWKFKFFEGMPSIYTGEQEDIIPTFTEWFDDVEAICDVTFWFGQRVDVSAKNFPFESWKRITTKTLKWKSIKTHQPVKITAWELRDWAEQKIPENAKVVLSDNAWEPDESVNFKFTFTSVESPEDFLREAKEAAKVMTSVSMEENAIWENTELENLITGVVSGSENIIRRLGIPEGMTPSLKVENVATSVKTGLFSISKMDEVMMQAIIEDAFITEGGPQMIASDQGVGRGEIEFRGVNFFTIEENVWISGVNLENRLDLKKQSVENQITWGVGENFLEENLGLVNRFMKALGLRNEDIWLGEDGKVHRYEIASLPFREESVEFNINLSGEGMTAEVTGDKRDRAEITIYAPPRSGGLRLALLLGEEALNLIQNSSFEDGDMGWSLTANVACSDNCVRTGDWSVKQTGLSGDYDKGMISDPVRIIGGRKYTCGAWACLIDPGSESIAENYDYQLEVKWLDEDREVINENLYSNSFTEFGRWGQFEFVSNAPVKAEYAQLVIRARAGQVKSTDVYWDDAYISTAKYVVITQRDYAVEVFGWVPKSVSNILEWSERMKSGERGITYYKREDSPTDLRLIMTNEWGASACQDLHVTPPSCGRLKAGELCSGSSLALFLPLAGLHSSIG